VSRSHATVVLAVVIVALATVMSIAGLNSGDGERATFTSVRGDVVELYGGGLYRYDSQFLGAGNRGTNAVTLALGVPLLAVATWLSHRGSLRGALLLVGTLGYFLYVYASFALYTAYNDLFLLYIATFSASLFALALGVTSIDLPARAARLTARFPRRTVGWFMLASGLVTLAVWLVPLLGALVAGEAPERLDHYTVTVTDVLDLGVITPAAFLAGVLVLRREALGVVLASSLLVLEVLLAPLIAAQTASQLEAGVEFETGEIVGPMAGFVVLSLLALWVLSALLRHVEGRRPSEVPGGEV